MALAAAPFAAQAETWNIYGWQNHSWEFVDEDHSGRSYDRIQSNAGNIGFAASMDAGNDISVNVQCEQFTYYNHFGGGTGWCNRNSKIGLSHADMGEIMFATWLLPYNEGVAQWVDPFYDAGADSHTSIMGSVGANTIFYNTGDFDQQASASGPKTGFSGAEFNYAGGGYDTGFNRRQENIIQYWSPNWNGFVFRFAWTAGNRDETPGLNGHEVDPVIRSSSLAYTNGPFWGAVTWQDHEDWTAVSVGNDDGAVMETSDAESIRVAGRYIMDLGDGMSVQISAMWEDLEYEFNGVVDVATAMAAFGYGNFATSYDLNPIGASPGSPAMPGPAFDSQTDEEQMTAIQSQKTYDLILSIYGGCFDGADAGVCPTGLNDALGYTAPTPDDPLTFADESAAEGAGGNGGQNILVDTDEDADGVQNALATALTALHVASDVDGTTDGVQVPDLEADEGTTTGGTADQRNAFHQYSTIKDKATELAMAAWAEANPGTAAVPANPGSTADQNVKIERDAWMVSGKIKFGGPIDFRFSYMDADDLEVSCASCSGDWDETAADAWNVGLFYTMPGGTELRLTYSEVDNDDNGTYGQGISGTGLGSAGAEVEMFAVGIVHWFD